jgi:alpha-glucosidase
MQWDTSPNAGFTTFPTPWLPVPASYKQRNVEAEQKDPDSLLNFYKQLIRLRRTQPALRDGAQITVNCHDADVLSFVRKNPNNGESVLVVLNMSNKSKTVSWDLKPQGLSGSSAKPLLAYPKSSAIKASLDTTYLPPFGTLVISIE